MINDAMNAQSTVQKQNVKEFASEQFIRAKLHSDRRSAFAQYRELVVGGGSIWRFLWYEMLTMFLGPIPGAFGLLLRKFFYPGLFRKCGKRVIFGRSLVIRNPQNIELGDGVLIDDYCLLDGRGGSEEAVRIGDRVILNRGVKVQAKIGTIRVGNDSDIGAGCSLVSQGGLFLGAAVSLGGDCKIGGGLIETQPFDRPAGSPNEASNVSTEYKLRKLTNGPVLIGDRTATGMAVIVLDNVQIGCDCIIGAGAVIRESIPDRSVATPHQRVILLSRSQN